MEKETIPIQKTYQGNWDNSSGYKKSGWLPSKQETTTTGWRPTCTHYPRVYDWKEYFRAKPGKKLSRAQEAENERIKVIRAELMNFWAPMPVIPCTILDPFAGAGTTGLVAAKMGRDAALIELKPEYCDMVVKRLKKELGMLAEIVLT